MLAAAAAFDFVVFTNRIIVRRLRHAKPRPRGQPRHTSNPQWRLPY
jgi:hypothetical protein